jgi:hypothetical protein
MHTGIGNGETHCVMMLPNPEAHNQYFVVDPTRMQYGEAGRGQYGENYVMCTLQDYLGSMSRICDQALLIGRSSHMTVEGTINGPKMAACAQKAWNRWQNRESAPWCSFSGEPVTVSNIVGCSRCMTLLTYKVVYCCKEQREADRELHKFNCS